jgi:hypothetical protein
MMFGLSCVILMRALLGLRLLVKILTIGSTKLSLRPGESLDDCFARFESIVSNLRSCGPFAYSDNERGKELLYALDDHVWGMKSLLWRNLLILLLYTQKNCLAS